MVDQHGSHFKVHLIQADSKYTILTSRGMLTCDVFVWLRPP